MAFGPYICNVKHTKIKYAYAYLDLIVFFNRSSNCSSAVHENVMIITEYHIAETDLTGLLRIS